MSSNSTAPDPGRPRYEEGPPLPDEFAGGSVIPWAVSSIMVATIFVGLRFYTRGVLLRTVAREDWLILVALVFAYCTMGSTIAMVTYGLGRHMMHIKPTLPDFYKSNIVTNLAYSISLGFTKASILCLYIRILTYDYVKFTAKILLVVVVISHLWIVCDLLTTCVPLEAFWDHSLRKTAYCHGFAIFWSNFGLHIGTDFLIFTLPLPVIFKLRIPRRQKIGLYIVFCFAFIVCIISVLRMVIFITNTRKDRQGDMTWTSVSFANWSMIEICASISCACLTTLKPLATRFFPGFWSSKNSQRSWQRDVELPDPYERPLTIGTRPTRGATTREDDSPLAMRIDHQKNIDDDAMYPVFGSADYPDSPRPGSSSLQSYKMMDVESHRHSRSPILGHLTSSTRRSGSLTPPLKAHIRN